MEKVTTDRMAHRRSAPDVWQASVMAGLVGLARQLKQPGTLRRTARRQWRQYKSYRALRSLAITPYFAGYPREAIPPQYVDLLGIYQLVIERRPRVVIELGGGYSTIVIAAAAKTLGRRGHAIEFHSVDESDHWQRIQKTHLPPELESFVNFHYAPSRLIEWNGEMVCAFESLPITSANLVYIDGGSIGKNQNGLDAVILERESPKDYAILIDGRRRTVDFLKCTLTRSYRVGPGRTGTQTLFTPKA